MLIRRRIDTICINMHKLHTTFNPIMRPNIYISTICYRLIWNLANLSHNLPRFFNKLHSFSLTIKSSKPTLFFIYFPCITSQQRDYSLLWMDKPNFKRQALCITSNSLLLNPPRNFGSVIPSHFTKWTLLWSTISPEIKEHCNFWISHKQYLGILVVIIV